MATYRPTRVIQTVTNGEVIAHVAEVTGGFSVAVQDVDSHEFVGCCVLFPSFERALAYAQKCCPVYTSDPLDTQDSDR